MVNLLIGVSLYTLQNFFISSVLFSSENKKELSGENEYIVRSSHRRNALYLIKTERNLADIDTTDKAHPDHI